MERIERILKECGIETYLIRKIRRESTELFYIKKKLDLRRITDVADMTVCIFKDVEKDGAKLRGRNDIIVDESMTDDEIREKIKAAAFAATCAPNKFFTLPDPEKSEEIVKDSDLMGMDDKDIADAFVKALYEEDHDDKAFINSFELFVYNYHVAIKGSTGVDVAYTKKEVSGEFVAQCKEPQDVETYQGFEYDSLATNDLKKLVRDTLVLTKDRAVATNMPKKGNYDVVLSGKYLQELMTFFLDRSNAAYVYQGYSNYEVGKNIQGEDVKGDVLNIRFGVNDPFNDEGIRMIERSFIEKGVLKTLHGAQRFCDYLGIAKIGTYSKVLLPEGSVKSDELKKNCLHVVNFSDFQMDSLDGHFKGEIRLAYLYDENGNRSVVTGGSVNGSIIEGMKDLKFSREMQKLANYEGPEVIKIRNVAVNGE
ncbi:MAG: hypothetical protein K6A74_02535 [Lachnospiraceae bacterium]|nr:hypothetical protein [Lachnospiraceae bacterium]